MDNTKTQIEELQGQIMKMGKTIESISNEVFKNNFSTRQDFNKASSFNTKLKVPHYTSLPAVAEVGEIIEYGGRLLICSSANTWQSVGSQS